jgi:ribulose kinase
MSNGYIKINIKGGEAGLKFAHLSNKLFLEAMARNGEYYADASGFNEIGWAKLFHCAYINNCVIKEAKQVLTLEDFVEWVESVLTDETAKEQCSQALIVWSEAQSTKEIIEKVNALNATDEKPKKGKKKE